MRFDNLRREVDKLKAQLPKEIVIRLRDGTEYRHPGPVIDFVVQGLREGHLGEGPIWSACRNSDQVSIPAAKADTSFCPAASTQRASNTAGEMDSV